MNSRAHFRIREQARRIANRRAWPVPAPMPGTAVIIIRDNPFNLLLINIYYTDERLRNCPPEPLGRRVRSRWHPDLRRYTEAVPGKLSAPPSAPLRRIVAPTVRAARIRCGRPRPRPA